MNADMMKSIDDLLAKRNAGDEAAGYQAFVLMQKAWPDVKRMRAALKPFADAVEPAKISGHPPFNFVGADDFQRAADVLG